MRRPARKAITLATCIVFITMLTAGCEEQNASDTRKSRLIANENRQLKKQLEQQGNEIRKQKELLAKCAKEKEVLKIKARENIKKQVDEVLGHVMEEIAKLREENSRFKAKIEKLEAELEQIKGPPGPKPL